MPKSTSLHNQHIQVEKGQEVDPQSAGNGGVVMKENWTIILSDRVYGDQFRVTIDKDTRNEIVQQLTGGIVLAGGEFPSV